MSWFLRVWRTKDIELWRRWWLSGNSGQRSHRDRVEIKPSSSSCFAVLVQDVDVCVCVVGFKYPPLFKLIANDLILINRNMN